jgi:hypothetical protein
MRTTMFVTLWVKILAIIAGIVCTLFGISFFYFGPEVHSEMITANERLFAVWLLLMVFLLFAASRTTRFRRIAALIFFWSVSFAPLALVIASFIESCLTRDSILARYHRMECMVILIIGLLFEARFYYVIRNRQPNA